MIKTVVVNNMEFEYDEDQVNKLIAAHNDDLFNDETDGYGLIYYFETGRLSYSKIGEYTDNNVVLDGYLLNTNDDITPKYLNDEMELMQFEHFEYALIKALEDHPTLWDNEEDDDDDETNDNEDIDFGTYLERLWY